jgi:hypothetical protein
MATLAQMLQKWRSSSTLSSRITDNTYTMAKISKILKYYNYLNEYSSPHISFT